MGQFLNEDCLFNVFLHAAQEPVLSDGSPLKLSAVPPLNFAAVCRSWKLLVMHNPVLWSFIHIVTPEYARLTQVPMHASLVRFVELWLKNSKGVPLSIQLDIFGPKQDMIYTNILHVIFSEQERWHEICIDSFNADDQDLPRPLIVQCSPSLSALELTLTNVRSSYPAFDVLFDLSSHSEFEANETTSRLSWLNIFGYTKWVLPRGQEQQQRLSLPNLTHLLFYTELRCELDVILSVLSASPNLCSLDIGDPSFRTDSALISPPRNTNQPVILLQHLVHFSLSTNGEPNDNTKVNLDLLLSHLSCPTLLTFICSSRRFSAQTEDLRCLASFLSRHRTADSPPPPLVDLKISYYDAVGYIPHDDDSRREHLQTLLALLCSLPHLEHLHTCGIYFDDRFVEALTPRNQISLEDEEHRSTGDLEIMLPSLEEWSMIWLGLHDLELDAGLVEEMLVSRAKCGKALTSLKLKARGFDDFEGRSVRLRELVANGLEIFCP